MFRLFLLCIFFVPSVFAQSALFEKFANCTTVESSEPIIVETLLRRLNYKRDELIELSKRETLSKAIRELEQRNQTGILLNAHFEYSPSVQSGYRFYQEVNGKFRIQIVDNCIDENKAIAIDEVDKLAQFSFILGIDNDDEESQAEQEIEYNFTFETNRKKIKDQSIKSHIISPEIILGARLGDSFSLVESLFGRFSLVWPLKNELKIALVGRNHAFYFQQDKLVGYQYGESLLPVALANRLELFSKELMIQFKGESIDLKGALTDEQVKLLKQEVGGLIVKNVSENKASTTSIKIKDFYIGKVDFETIESDLVCLNGRRFHDQILKKTGHLVQFVDQWDELNYLSACRQILQVGTSGKVLKLELLDEWSSKNASLPSASQLFDGFKPWSFLSITQNTKLSGLENLGQVDVFLDTAEFESSDGLWRGQFFIEDERLISAELEPNTL